jgi:nicotinate phosphoribosyltransferase
MNAVQKMFPDALVKYSFINRDNTPFPAGFADKLKNEVASMAEISLNRIEEQFLKTRCYYFDPVFIDLLKGYRYDPEEVKINQIGENLQVEIEGLWYRTVLWEVPVLAIISELYYSMMGKKPDKAEKRTIQKAITLKKLMAEYSDFGTRRRFSFDIHDMVISNLIKNSGNYFNGTSNVFLAMKYNLTPIGTHPHEWFMYHASRYGYRLANTKALDGWIKVYKGNLGIALSDTFTSDNFFRSFSVLHAKLFDGIRQDSGNPFIFTDKTVEFYKSNRIDPLTKTIVYSDSLNLDLIEKIRKYVNGRIHDVYGVGTYLTNDVGLKPLNIVIKLTGTRSKTEDRYHPAIKLSDDEGKHTGDPAEIRLCKKILDL